MRVQWPWCVIGVLLVVGHLFPWARHATAALTLSGHDLAIFTNDTPYAGVFANEWFYIPAWSAGLLIALSGAAGPRSPAWSRWLLAGAGAFVAALGMPPFEKLRAPAAIPADYQARLVISLAIMAGCLAIAIPRPWRAPAWIATCVLAACVVPVYGYSLVRWPIEQLYGNAVDFGIGWWLTLGATAAGLALAAAPLARRFRNKE